MPRALIAGCGYVGVATADLFHATGWDVEGWTHSAGSAAKLADKPYPVRAVDITSAEGVKAAAKSFDAVIHCASSGGGGPEGYRRVYLEGARNLVAAGVADASHTRFLYTSSTSVYAQTDGEWVDEESAAEPTHETGLILRQTEEFVRQSGGMVARLAGIYGPGRSALLRKFLSGEARIDANRARYVNQAHRYDIAAALFQLVSLPDERMPANSIFNVVDDQPITERACYEWLAARLTQPIPPTSTVARTSKRGLSNKRVRNAKLRGLGWTPRFPTFASGMENSVLPAAIQAGGL
jgi:nucleoside-diphosphate-sugar epimerase